jgi:5-methyltetrahydropteroyltriglutamate--homocysteine methyltransferase
MAIAHNLGFPRMGLRRELKWALERYWKGEINQDDLQKEGQRIRSANWAKQIEAGHDFLSVGDFSWYDHVLDMSALLGVVPNRFGTNIDEVDLDTYFRMARGRAPSGKDTFACEMTKWFDTNYHYIVPEFNSDQDFKVSQNKLFKEVKEAQLLGKKIKPILLGPLSYLWLGKVKQENFDKLTLLKKLKNVYVEVLTELTDQGIEWVQIDEPILVLDLPPSWQKAFQETYEQLQVKPLKLLLTTYFGGLGENAELACQLPTAGLHIDVVRDDQQIHPVLSRMPVEKILSIGIVDGRNIWRTDLRAALNLLMPLQKKLTDRLWIGTSCSLLHCPVDLSTEQKLDVELKSWLAFATQKLDEISLLTHALNQGEAAIEKELADSDKAVKSKMHSSRIHNPAVKQRHKNISAEMITRMHDYGIRKKVQKKLLKLPLFPTTTIGSFPQTKEVRAARYDYKNNKLDKASYLKLMREQIAYAVREQMDLDIDVLVHGECERNDMVEYFGELLEGFAFTENGWVQSYGSRCVKPPIIFGDVSRIEPMTLDWISYAQSQADRPVKGMLTGPITILCWSFVRNDQSRFETAKQIALALRDEVDDLVKAGVQIIQIDEPAFREGLPLRQEFWREYLDEAVESFRLASCSVPDHVQIHTHMCYAEFNDIIEAVAALDADVITIETTRSAMELLKAFENFHYPNDIGPGVYDIHSPRIPTVEEIVTLIDKAIKFVPIQQLWINPDCGLKTRDWSETKLALKNMMTATQILRDKYAVKQAIKEH